LFWLLAAIEVGIAAVWLAIQAPSIETWFAELVRRIMFIGFFLFVLQKGPALAKAIVTSLMQIGSQGGSASAADIFNMGITVGSNLSSKASFGLTADNTLGLALLAAALIVVVVFALLAGMMIAAMAEAYIGLMLGMIMLGLGGSSYTKDWSVRYLVYAFSLGMKLMALVAIAHLGQTVLTSFVNNSATDFITAVSVAAIAIVIFMVAMHVPNIIQGVVQGASVSNGMEALRSAGHAGSFASAAFGGLAGGAVGAAMLSSNARAQGGGVGSSAMAAMRAVGSAAAEKAMGSPGSRMSSVLGLANEKLRPTASGAQQSDARVGGGGHHQ
jgi:type IV secretion system protein TrbL